MGEPQRGGWDTLVVGPLFGSPSWYLPLHIAVLPPRTARVGEVPGGARGSVF